MKTLSNALLGLFIILFFSPVHAGVPIVSLTVTPWNVGDTMNFGNQTVGSTSPSQGTTLTANVQYGNGSEQAQITSLVVNGSTDFDLGLGGTNCGVGTMLGDGEPCSFPTTFSPSAAGIQTGTIRITCQLFSAVTAATVLCNGIEQTIVSLAGTGIVTSQIPIGGQWAAMLMALGIVTLALAQLRRKA